MRAHAIHLGAALFLMAGCTVYTREDPAPPPTYYEAPPVARATPRPPTTRSSPPIGTPLTNWVKLGQGTANGANDHDVIQVGRGDGSFRAIRFDVRNSAVRIWDVVVHFTDGRSYSPNTPVVFREGAASDTIDLPGGRRTIESVNFRYSDSTGSGSAVVEVWGI